MTTRTDRTEVEARISEAEAMLSDLDSALRAGDDVDFTSFNEVVHQACSGVVGLPPETLSEVRPRLETLLARLNDTRATLDSQAAAAGDE